MEALLFQILFFSVIFFQAFFLIHFTTPDNPDGHGFLVILGENRRSGVIHELYLRVATHEATRRDGRRQNYGDRDRQKSLERRLCLRLADLEKVQANCSQT